MEKANDPGPDPDPVSGPMPDPESGAPGRSTSADRLVARLAELRGQLEVLAPQDQERGREAIERIRQAQERIATLEEMLAQAREREDGLTTQAIRDRARISELESHISELSSIAARVSAAEEAHREAVINAADSDRARELAEAEAKAQAVEAERFRTRCSELESDLKGIAEELAAAAVARAKAARLEAERNEAWERARTERRLAAEDRVRAARADHRATHLQSQLRAAERRIVQVTNERGASAAKEEVPPEVVESTRSEAPWTTLQRATSAAAGPPTSAPSGSVPPPPSDAEGPEPAVDADLIDLTDEEPTPVEEDAPNGTAERGNVPAVSGTDHPRGAGLLGRVLRGRHHDPGTDQT